MVYGKNTKTLFNLVGVQKNLTQLKNQINEIKFTEIKTPTNVGADTDRDKGAKDQSFELDKSNKHSNILKAIKTALNEFIENAGGAKQAF